MAWLWGRDGEPSKREKTRIVRDSVDALNAFDREAAARVLSPEIVLTDALGRSIEGFERFWFAHELRERLEPGYVVTIEKIGPSGDKVQVTGTERSDERPEGAKIFWDIAFEGERIARVGTFRADNEMALPSLALRHGL